jgi:hypothetical protein
MSTNLTKYDNIEDIVEVLTPYIQKSHTSIHVTEHDAAFFLQKIREGLLVIGEMYAKVSYMKGQAELELNRTEARLRLEEFPAFAAQHNIQKPTEKDKWAFIVRTDEYETAYSATLKWEAVAKYLETVRSSFYSCMDEVKKNVYSSTHYSSRQIQG